MNVTKFYRWGILSIFLLTMCLGVSAQLVKTKMSYYLPSHTEYDTSIPTPDKILGYMPGDQHATHDQIYYYAKTISGLSKRFRLLEIGRTYENRPYIVLIITSEQNQQRLDEIKKEHLKLSDPSVSSSVSVVGQPSFVWLGHSIHGNEASGANASLLTMYHLAAAKGAEIDKILDNEIIFLDPSENPDGLTRFSGWVNQHRFTTSNNADPQSREHIEAWPGGRFNHYWFDLNRDWLPLQMPESQARVKTLLEWKPNILIDEHEQGTNATFHVSPGEPNRVHPLIPKENQEYTVLISQYVTKALDSIGSLYTSKEGYDDYYNGRGPTYLDFNGGIAMLFEQARSGGYAQESDNGLLTFPFGVKNQFVASLAVINAGLALKNDLLEYQRKYYKDAISEGNKNSSKAYVFGSIDKASAYRLAEVLKRHNIEVYHLAYDKEIKGIKFKYNNSFVVPLAQNQYRLIESIFEKRTVFKDSLFYDISGWTFPLAFNQDYVTVDKAGLGGLSGSAFTLGDLQGGKVIGGKSNYAYILEWTGYYSPKALYKLLEQGIIAKITSNPFTGLEDHLFARGSVLIPVQGQKVSVDELFNIVSDIASKSLGTDFYAINTGSTFEGNHLGSTTFQRLDKPSIFTFVGGRVDPLNAGAIWHLLDTQYEIPVTLIPIENALNANFQQYNTLILADGEYGLLGEELVNKLKTWVEAGNVIVAYENALPWLGRIGLLNVQFKKQRINGTGIYSDFQLVNRAANNPGAIVEIAADLTHPLFYGFSKKNIPYYKSTNLIIADSVSTSYNHPARFSTAPLLSGYLPRDYKRTLANSPAVTVQTRGKGRIIALIDDTNFRGFWYGTNKILANGVFFGGLINPGTGSSTNQVSNR